MALSPTPQSPKTSPMTSLVMSPEMTTTPSPRRTLSPSPRPANFCEEARRWKPTFLYIQSDSNLSYVIIILLFILITKTQESTSSVWMTNATMSSWMTNTTMSSYMTMQAILSTTRRTKRKDTRFRSSPDTHCQSSSPVTRRHSSAIVTRHPSHVTPVGVPTTWSWDCLWSASPPPSPRHPHPSPGSQAFKTRRQRSNLQIFSMIWSRKLSWVFHTLLNFWYFFNDKLSHGDFEPSKIWLHAIMW